MRQFFVAYPIYATMPHKLGWSHYVEILKFEDELDRSFYEKQSVNERWGRTALLVLAPEFGLF
jgi:hypothetical protein